MSYGGEQSSSRAVLGLRQSFQNQNMEQKMLTFQRTVKRLFTFGPRGRHHSQRQKNACSGSHCYSRQLQIEPMEQRALLSIGVPKALYLPPQYDLYNLDGYLTKPMSASPLDIAMNYLRSNADKLGLTPDDFTHTIITDQYTDADTGITHIYLEQEYNDLEVFYADMVVNVKADGCVINVGGGFVPGLNNTVSTSMSALSVAPEPMLSASEALQHTALSLGLTDVLVPTGEPFSQQWRAIDIKQCARHDFV